MRAKIQAYHAVAAWKWNLPDDSDDTCGICRVHFEGTCSKCKYPGSDCPISIGSCSHCFHMHCINEWLQGGAGNCPMCRQPFTEVVAAPTSGGTATTAAGNAPAPTGTRGTPAGREMWT